ncbi:ribosome silencing factor [Acidipila sp. EB88]|nr:ribosome silencing factor [Acidipila sp. EB88]
MVLLAAEVCEEKKATNTRILELDQVDAGFTDFFLITSGSNTRQTGAIADDIELRLKREFGAYAKSVEGRRAGDWILLDYVDFVVHVFTEETREFYDIERLRKSARAVDTAELAAALREKTETVRKKASGKAVAKRPETLESRAIAARDASLAEQAEQFAGPAKKAAKKAPAKKAPAKKAPAKKAAAKKAPAKKAPAKKAPAKTVAVKKAPAKKAAAKAAPPAAGKQAAKAVDTSLKALPSGAPAKLLKAPTKAK